MPWTISKDKRDLLKEMEEAVSQSSLVKRIGERIKEECMSLNDPEDVTACVVRVLKEELKKEE